MKQRTRNYSIFKKHGSNREYDLLALKKLKASIESKNLLEWRPILVDKQMKIIDGQHRLKIAEELGLEIFYEVQKDLKAEDMVLLNTNQKSWTAKDYIHFYSNEGYEEYDKILEFSNKNKLPLSLSISLLSFGCGSYRNLNTIISKGEFIFPNNESLEEINIKISFINKIRDLVRTKTSGNKQFLNRNIFYKSLIFFMNSSYISPDVFYKKITLRLDLFGSRPSLNAYILLFKEIYNYKNCNPVNIEMISGINSLK